MYIVLVIAGLAGVLTYLVRRLSPADIYVDSKFTLNERVIIREAANRWERTTTGAAKVNLIWGQDMDASDDWANAGRVRLLRVDPAPFVGGLLYPACGDVGAVGCEFREAIIRGVNKAEDIWVMPDPRWSNEALLHVVMHELGHHFGLEHVAPGEDPANQEGEPVMSAQWDSDRPQILLTTRDIVEFVRVNQEKQG